MYKGAKTDSEIGSDEIKKGLNAKLTQYETELNEMEGDDSSKVGFIDGFASVYTGCATNRMTENGEYESAVSYGQWAARGTQVRPKNQSKTEESK